MVTFTRRADNQVIIVAVKVLKKKKSFNRKKKSKTTICLHAKNRSFCDFSSSTTTRDGRAIQTPYKYIPTSNTYINRRVDPLVPLGPGALKQNFNFNGPSTQSGNRPNQFFNNRVQQNGPAVRQPDVSETDLYLLSAIEKLVYRVDYMERRLRKTEQIVYYLMAGNNEHQKEVYGKISLGYSNFIDVKMCLKYICFTPVEKPCARNFTRVGDNCYLFVVNKPANWKTANNVCRSYGGHLAELEGSNENNDMTAYLLNHQQHLNGHGNYWLGALNPGLLWIWSSSAKPVNSNVNLTQIHNSTQSASVSPKVTTKIQSDDKNINKKGSNSTVTVTVKPTTTTTEKKIENTKITHKPANEHDMKIEGNGRCLGMTYKLDKHTFQMYGLDCNSHQRYICELPDDDISNEIDRIAKKLFN